jgi:DNA-binding transcriptional MerR regulator
MQARFKIGDFSQLGQVSVRTLRHYDELGLIKPAETDRWSGYRYYTLDQLPRLNRILALKDLGLSLEQISVLLKNDLPVREMRAMLEQKQAELELQLTDVKMQMQRVAARLSQVENEDKPPRFEVSLKQVEAETIASLRLNVPHVKQMGEIRFKTLTDLYNELAANEIRPLDPEIFVYHLPGYTDEDIDMEVATAIDPSVIRKHPGGIDKVAFRVLDAFPTVASVVYHGDIWDIPQAIIALYTWVGKNSLESAGPYREFHYGWREHEMTEDALCNVTLEIQLPVTPLSSAS